MTKLSLIIGGAGSGKSEYAESLILKASGRRIYLASMHRDESRETALKIQRHLLQREKKNFITLEREKNIGSLSFDTGDSVLLEDLSNLLANEMFSDPAYRNNKTAFSEKIFSDIEALLKNDIHLYIVSNDIFSDGCRYDKITRDYIEELARLNALIAENSDLVVRVVCGIPILLKEK